MVASKRILHAIILSCGWLLYLYLFWHLRNYPNHLAAHLWELTLILGVLILMLTSIWMVRQALTDKNKSYIRPETTELSYVKDWEQHSVVADWDQLKNTNDIEIIIEGNKKIYKEV